VLLQRRGPTLAGRPLVYYDGSEGSHKALTMAEQVADRATGVGVLVVAPDQTERQRLHAEAEFALRAHGYAVRFEDATAPDLADLCAIASSSNADMLLIDADNALVAGESRASLLEQIACPVLLVH
jgi:nucleotide-binding universal stress UspA family protein